MSHQRRRTAHFARWLSSGLSLLASWTILVGRAEAQRASASACTVPDGTLRAAVTAVHEKQRNVGVAAAIRRGHARAFRADIGFADLEHRVSVDSTTVFGIASVTKLFTAVALLLLHDRGRLDLDAEVQEYVPEYPQHEAGPITLRRLATHRSGIPHPSERTPELFATHYETALAALEVFTDDTLVAVPGAQRVYSSSNYNLLAAVIERVYGEPFPTAMSALVLEPLELEHTQFDHALRPTPGRAERYSFYHPWTYEPSDSLYYVPRWDYSFNMGGGGLTSTVSDLTVFGQALMSPGLLSSDALAILYDEAWFGRAETEGRLIFVTGANPGVQAALAVAADDGMTTAVLANTWGIGSRSGEMVTLATRLTDLCAGR